MATTTVQQLIAKKDYGKAVDALKAQLKTRPKDERLRLQLADVLILASRGREAVQLLLQLADDQAAEGFAAKAIAVLKRIEKVEPGRRDVEDRLAKLIHEKVRHAPTAAAPSGPEFGFEEIDSAAPEIAFGAAPPGSFGMEAAGEMDVLDMVAAESAPTAPRPPLVSTPLFEGLAEDELVALIRGLRLLSFAPGDVLVTEGAPGDSMFILTMGSVKCYVRSPKGTYMKVCELGEGAFFGEISVLTGKPRTATITAASHCEVLELDKPTLDSFAQTHPRIREVLKEFQDQRARDTVEQIIRSRKA